jgi:hypothetical protein
MVRMKTGPVLQKSIKQIYNLSTLNINTTRKYHFFINRVVAGFYRNARYSNHLFLIASLERERDRCLPEKVQRLFPQINR